MRNLSKNELIERSILKKYRKVLWTPFVSAIKKYHLIEKDDKIAVCISGGKDSLLLAKLMILLKRITEVPFEIMFIAMDPGYSEKNLQKLKDNLELLEIDAHFFKTDIFDVANSVDKSPCYLCARMRRGYLYSKAKELGANKIALGHHMSDVIETTLMGMFYSGQIQGMLPKLKSTNFEGMELIRPMYMINEDDIILWRDYNELSFLQCACRFTENIDLSGDGVGESKRQEVKKIIKELKKDNPLIEKCLFNSIHNVSVDTMVEYKLNGENKSFLDKFETSKGDIL